MCTEILIDNKYPIATIEELIEYLGDDDLIFSKHYPSISKEDFDCCLCPVNVSKTLKKHGIPFKRDTPMEICIPNVKEIYGDEERF